jgi:hypothetical protein
MTPDTAAPQTLKLARCGMDDPGRALGLHSGDILIGVAGQPWQGSSEALRARLSAATTPLLLSFLRGDVILSILASRADLGRWEPVARPTGTPALPKPDPRMCNWQIMRHHDGHHDLFALHQPLLAVIAPPLWLAQERLFTWLVALGSALALAWPGGPILMIVVWIVAGLHLWRNGPAYIRQARLADGYRPAGMVAARNATEARAAWDIVIPEARFRFDSTRTPVASAAEQPAL